MFTSSGSTGGRGDGDAKTMISLNTSFSDIIKQIIISPVTVDNCNNHLLSKLNTNFSHRGNTLFVHSPGTCILILNIFSTQLLSRNI